MRALLKRPTDFRGLRLAEGALPPREILDQSRYLLNDAPLSYRWTIPFLVRYADKIVGSIGGKGILEDEDVVEIGYNVAPAHRGRGVGTLMVSKITSLAKHDGIRLPRPRGRRQPGLPAYAGKERFPPNGHRLSTGQFRPATLAQRTSTTPPLKALASPPALMKVTFQR